MNGKHLPLTREPTDTTPVIAIFGGTTQIREQIIARDLGLKGGPGTLRSPCAQVLPQSRIGRIGRHRLRVDLPAGTAAVIRPGG